jgi:glucose-1-phosphate cytidylyltransferase
MKVVILCGGKGTRLGEVTSNLVPKPMAMVGNEPILVHIMRSYSRFGHREFILCAGHLSWAIKSYFLDYHARRSDVTIFTGKRGEVTFHDTHELDDWKVTIAETGAESGTGGRLRKVAQYIEPSESFMLTYGDGVSDVDLAKLEAFHHEHGKLVTMTGVVPPGRFGELVLDGDTVKDWAEKPIASDRYINGGFMVMRREFIDRFLANKDDEVMLEREPLVEATAADELMLFRHGGFWQCMDTARDWTLLNELWESGNAPWVEG